MTFIATANPSSRILEEQHNVAYSIVPREKSLRSMLVKTISWRGFKKPDDDRFQNNTSNPLTITGKHPTDQEDGLSSSNHQSLHRKTSLPFPKMKRESYHSFSSEESFAEEDDDNLFEWADESPSCDVDDKQPSLRECDDVDESSILLFTKQTNCEAMKADNFQQSQDSSRRQPTRHLERQESRRRRKQKPIRRYSLGMEPDFHASGESWDSASSLDKSLDKSDSIDLGSSRHSVGRSNRRRTTHNRHLHHLPRQKQQHSVSTSSDPLSNYSCTSILHKRLESNLQAQSQHSVMSRENPRYVVVKADPEGTNEDKRGRSEAVEEPQRYIPTRTITTIDNPRFIVVNAKPRDYIEKEERQHSRRGRRRRTHSVEKSHSV